MVQDARLISASSKAVTVIVPTLNEVENIDALLEAILAQATFSLDVLVADGGSVDGTIERVRDWETRAPVRLIAGEGRGLAGDVLTAARQTTSAVIVVMDADFSHPPASIPKLVAPILAGTSDMVVGSRYVPGGSVPNWPLHRQILSRMGGALAWPLSDIHDPMSGFFAIRRSSLLAVDPTTSGFKIGLEAMAVGGDELRVTEVPITFTDRKRGTSKMSLWQMAAFARRLMVLAGGAVSMGTAARFATVGVLGIGVDYIAFTLLLAIGASLLVAHTASFILATVFNYILNSQWSFSQSRHAWAEPVWRQYARFLTVCLLAFFLRGGILATAVDGWGWSPEAAVLLAIAGAAIVNYIGSAFFVFPSLSDSVSRSVRLRVLAVAVLGYVILLHLAFLGSLNLIPEEAYYWNYSQHLDIGYLDHPPMVAWLIWLGTTLGGHTEFAVRLGASLSWLIAGLFCFLLTRNLYGKTAAFVAVLMFCTLPFFFTSGLLMTPDAPLTAAWAGALYFLERALIGERREAWLGVGVCLGLGMLSKYTIALLGPATILFVLLDPQLRRWLWHPAPYLAVAIAALVFSPVIVWNWLHDWASFSFHAGRFNETVSFSLPMMLGSILLLLTPVGLAAAVCALFQQDHGSEVRWLAARRMTFVTIYTLVPLSVFLAFSLFHEVKLNWTGPVWLALLPALASNLAAKEAPDRSTAGAWLRPWLVTMAILLLAYGGTLHYLALGLPGVNHYSSFKSLPVGWKEFGAQVEKIETDLENVTGKEPLRIGMDRYFLSSQIAFYDPDKDAVPFTAGRSLLGLDSLMYDRWFSPTKAKGEDILLISRSADGPIAGDKLVERFQYLGPILEHVILKDGLQLGKFYYRIGYSYMP